MPSNRGDIFACKACTAVVEALEKSGCTPRCCGQEMTLQVPNTVDAAKEKHVPVVEKSASGGVLVKVGAVAHPMLDAHYITFIVLETSQGYQKKDLKPGDKPEAVFALAEGETVVAAYEYCNLHGLWKAEA